MKKVKKIKKEIEDETLYCDICKKEMCWSFNDISLIVEDKKESYHFGQEGGYIKSYNYDICEECVEKYLFPFIKEKTNKEPRIEEREW